MRAVEIRKSKWMRLMAALLCIVCTLCMFPIAAVAAGNATFTVIYSCEGIDFSLYRVAEQTADGFVGVGQYAGFEGGFDTSTASAGRKLTEELVEYTAEHEIASTALKTTGSNGRAVFDGLEAGLYLVIGEEHAEAGLIYTPTAFVIILTDNSEMYADVKSDVTEEPTPEPTEEPTPEPTPEPTEEPTVIPTVTVEPTSTPELGTITNTGVEDYWPYYLIGCIVLLVISGVMVYILHRKKSSDDETE